VRNYHINRLIRSDDLPKISLIMPQPNFQHPFTKEYHKKLYPAIDLTKPSSSAAGKTIIITAGHTGIGYAIAQNFAVAGATNIIILARRQDVLEIAAKKLSADYPQTRIHFFAGSIDDHEAIKRIFQKIRSSIAEPTILITSAAYVAASSTVLELPAEQLRASFETNVVGNANLVQEFLNAEGKGEKIIVDISSAAIHLHMPDMGAYSISKLAFTQWLVHLHEQLGEKVVRIHSVHPGAVLTDAARAFGLNETTMDWDDVHLPGRFVVWLASKEGEFLKGRFVWANWDVEELMRRRDEFERDPDLLRIGLMAQGL
jgi:NAD(P)-dependent dehydrogenase (short-subunit alcohol dehydrogenase family)